jgi:hypothetical protein
VSGSRIPKRSVAALVGVVGLLTVAWGAPASASAATCPGFRVLHNDRIGAASFPAGSYSVTASTVTCAEASKLFARFLEDYDGVLPRPWRVVGEGSGRASFKRAGRTGFSVRLGGGGGGGGGNSPLGALCSGSYTVNAGQRVGPLTFPRGRYLLYIPPRSAISCRRATVLFTRFLASPGGALPRPWRVISQTATFYKPANPTRSSFRVEPFAGAGVR